MPNNQQSFDGIAVESYQGRFGGSFDLDEEVATKMAFDDEVTFVVRGRVSGAVIKETKSGDLLRVNVFDVTSVATLSDDIRETITEQLEQEQGVMRLPMEGHSITAKAEANVPFTGELVDHDADFDDRQVLASITRKDEALDSFLQDV